MAEKGGGEGGRDGVGTGDYVQSVGADGVALWERYLGSDGRDAGVAGGVPP